MEQNCPHNGSNVHVRVVPDPVEIIELEKLWRSLTCGLGNSGVACSVVYVCTLIPRLSGPRSYGLFHLPGTLWASFSGNITTLLSLFVELVTSDAIFMAFPHQNVCELRSCDFGGICHEVGQSSVGKKRVFLVGTTNFKMYVIRNYGHFEVTGSAGSQTLRINEL